MFRETQIATFKLSNFQTFKRSLPLIPLVAVLALGMLLAGCNPLKQATKRQVRIVTSADLQPSTTITPFVMYNGGVPGEGWEDASWRTKADLKSNDFPRDGKPTIKVEYETGWGGFALSDWKGRNTPDGSNYNYLHFWINGGAKGGQVVGAMLYSDGEQGMRLHVEEYIKEGKVPANQWQEVFIPLEDLESEGIPLERVAFQDVTGDPQPAFYLDGIELYRDNAPDPTPVASTAQITVDLSQDRKPISPLIYGVGVAPSIVITEGNIPLNRMGGNPYSRYNWTLGSARNAGTDWEYRNYSRENDDPAYKEPSGLADLFFKANKAGGAETILTVPMVGWVARDENSDTQSVAVPKQGGPPAAPGSYAIEGYDPTKNRDVTSVPSQARKGAPFQDPPDKNAEAVYQDEWIYHLTQTFGKAAEGGVRFYAMDNEPDLWADSTHVDVHPVRAGYDEMLAKFTEYATAVKAVDPTAQVTGPVVSGWTSYWFSALDRGDDNFKSPDDRKAHGNVPLIPWFLDQVRKHDEAAGTRTLDVLDIHYYPQGDGLYAGRIDRNTSALRLRSTRSLWDPKYKDESWISRTEAPEVQLIPRMKAWIDQYYPGTKLGITEWKWGADGKINGALAIAEVLGIYGREGVYLANYWGYPPLEGPGFAAFKLYRNYDGEKGTFGDTSVQAQSSDWDKISVFASDDTRTNQVKIMVINKTPNEQISTTIDLKGGSTKGPAHVYQVSKSTERAIGTLPDAPVEGTSLHYTFDPYSITLLVIDKP